MWNNNSSNIKFTMGGMIDGQCQKKSGTAVRILSEGIKLIDKGHLQ